MNEARLLRRLVRRERYRSRSMAVVVALVVTALVAAALGAELVLRLLNRAAFFVSPDQIVDVATRSAPWSIPAASVLAVLGVVALIAALTPGSRQRHRLADDRLAIVIDDDLLAGAVSRAAARTGAVPRRQVVTRVDRRRAHVRVTPASGYPVDRALVEVAASDAVASLAPTPKLRTRVSVAEHGVLS